VEIYRAPNGRELASLLDKVNLRMPRGKGGVIDWHESKRGWQARGGAGRRGPCVTCTGVFPRRERNGSGPRDAGPALTRDDITRSAKALGKYSHEDSK
jgi:hypothetical protein